MAVFYLKQDLTNYSGLELFEPKMSLHDQVLFAQSFLGDSSLLNRWRPVHVRQFSDQNGQLGDFPLFGAFSLAFSVKAVTAIKDILDRNGELLPLISSSGDFTAYKIRTYIDALDVEKSEVEYWSPRADPRGIGCEGGVAGRRIRTIKRAVVRESLVRDATLFKIPNVALGVGFVTDAFVDRVREAGLQGFLFDLLWPIDCDAERRMAETKYKEKRFRKRGESGHGKHR